MAAQRIDGKAIAASLRVEIKNQVTNIFEKEGWRPGLAVVIVGDDPASQIYVRNKARACEECGIVSTVLRLPSDITNADLLSTIHRLNEDESVHGILLQLPIPAHLDATSMIEAISPEKDVDGFSVQSAGNLFLGRKGLRPCTPSGCIALIESTGADIAGKHAVVVGRSDIVGKPIAMMLLEKNATVTVCHSKTANLPEIVAQADILIAAIGRPHFIQGEWLKDGAIIIDVGINRLPDSSICGDVDFELALTKALWITPVPGGVGPMTIAMLMKNTVQAALDIQAKQKLI